MKVLRSSEFCCPTAVLAALLHEATAAFLLLRRWGRTVEHALGTVVPSGVGRLQCVPAIVSTHVGAGRGVQSSDGRWWSVAVV